MTIIASKFFKLLSSLSVTQKEEFKLYSENKIFNASSKVNVFINIVMQDIYVVDKKIIYKHIYPNKKYKDIDLRMLLSKAYLLLKDYLMIAHLFTKEGRSYELQIKSALAINHIPFQEEVLTAWQKSLNQEAKHSEAYFRENKLFQEYNQLIGTKKITDVKRLKELNFDALNSSIDNLYILQKLKHFITQINYQNMVKGEGNLTLYKEIENHILGLDEVPIVLKIYYGVIQLYLQFNNEANFFEVKSWMQEEYSNFSKEETRQIYLHLQNFCIRKVNKGESKFLTTLYKIYFEMLENQSIYENNLLSQWTFKNIVSAGLRLKDYAGVETFMNTYSTKLPKNQEETALAFNLANLKFYTEDYDKSIELLQNLNSQDVFYLLGSKVLLAKSFFELEEREALLFLIESFQKLLSRKKLMTKRHLITHANFLKYLKKTMNLNSKKAKVLLKQLKEQDNIAERKWLESKIQEFLRG